MKKHVYIYIKPKSLSKSVFTFLFFLSLLGWLHFSNVVAAVVLFYY